MSKEDTDLFFVLCCTIYSRVAYHNYLTSLLQRLQMTPFSRAMISPWTQVADYKHKSLVNKVVNKKKGKYYPH